MRRRGGGCCGRKESNNGSLLVRLIPMNCSKLNRSQLLLMLQRILAKRSQKIGDKITTLQNAKVGISIWS
ncbi:hypothetical protein MKW98_032167 [Papaver atlanticum]|uniref:Uncharacterized protein n=1 Tax=Papaver atlanticum TaxID=357466 RepID=A0AAD4XE75_9MAGN|nr:hypothetical protein MKW98_032167 [Papaver atlanticum]